MKRPKTMTIMGALIRAVAYMSASIAACCVALFAVGGAWTEFVLIMVVVVANHIAGYWFGYAAALRHAGTREVFVDGMGVIVQVTGPELPEAEKEFVLNTLRERYESVYREGGES